MCTGLGRFITNARPLGVRLATTRDRLVPWHVTLHEQGLSHETQARSLRPLGGALGHPDVVGACQGRRRHAPGRRDPAHVFAHDHSTNDLTSGLREGPLTLPLTKAHVKMPALRIPRRGEVREWTNRHAWKACVPATGPWVRIPPSPPYFISLTGRQKGEQRELATLLMLFKFFILTFGLGAGPCATEPCEPRQVRKEATVSGQFCVPQDHLAPLLRCHIS